MIAADIAYRFATPTMKSMQPAVAERLDNPALAGCYGHTSKGRGRRGEKGRRGKRKGKEKWRGGITMGFSLPKVGLNFLVTSPLMFSFIFNAIEAVGAYIK